MTIQLSAEQEQFIRALIDDGRFSSEDAVIDAALQLLQNYGDESKLAQLRRDIGEAIDQADRGELTPFDPHATLGRIRGQEARRGAVCGRVAHRDG